MEGKQELGSEELVVGMRPASSKGGVLREIDPDLASLKNMLMMFTVLQRSAARYQSGHLRHSRVIKQCMLLL